ncbi:MAG: PKD domain-containing protein [Methylomicrobium sp.]|nr:PKD domain-containing protein [Methylomicrobium sp.]
MIDDPTAASTFLTPFSVGTYVLTLIVFDGTDFSLPSRVTINIVQNLPPNAVATAAPLSGPVPLTVMFDGSASSDPEGLPLRYSWDFGDYSLPVEVVSPTHVYEAPGTYAVALYVIDSANQADVYSLTVDVTLPGNTPPEANAGPNQTIYFGQPAYLNGTATDADEDAIVGWQWTLESAPDGGGGSIDDPTAASTSFAAYTVGSYVLTLVAFDGEDYSLPSSVTINVVQNQPPTAIASGAPLTGSVPLTVAFDGSVSSDPEGLPLRYVWDFGDASPSSSDVSPTHVYLEAGTYSVALTVTDSANQQDAYSLVVDVSLPGNHSPTASPVATPNNGTAPLTVVFASNAADPDNDSLTYAWDFGDAASSDNTSTEANPMHVYHSEGNYIAKLTVSDGQDEVTASVDVVVAAAPQVTARKIHVVGERDHAARKAKVSIWADVGFGSLVPDDLIAVKLDGVTLFEARFAEFKPGREGDVYLLLKRDLLVRIDLAEQSLFVEAKRVNLAGTDFSNGATLTVSWGNHVGTDQFELDENPGHVWHHRHHRSDHDGDFGHDR